MSVEVVVPFLAKACPHRAAAWEWCRERYEYPVRQVLGSEPWIKAVPFMAGVHQSKAEIIVMADADVFSEGLPEAIQAVQEGAPWARPHTSVVRLSEEGTKAYMAGAEWNAHSLDRLPYGGIDGGGVLVAPRATFLEIPIDPRFTGWGNEDWAHGFAFFRFKGPIWRGDYPLIHLWHPPEPRDVNGKDGSPENRALWQRYKNARSNLTEMHRLLEEARVALAAHEQAVHDRSPDRVGVR